MDIGAYPKNELLPLDFISDLAFRFCIATDDRIKQDNVDELGDHPKNHANFMIAIHDFTCGGVALLYAIADYQNATTHLD